MQNGRIPAEDLLGDRPSLPLGNVLRRLIARARTWLPGQEAPTEQRPQRRLERRTCSLPVSCRLGQATMSGTVTDVGLRGMRLELPLLPQTGQEVAVRYRNPFDPTAADLVRARVVWCRRRRFSGTVDVGVRYEESFARLSHSWVRQTLRHIGVDTRSIDDRRRLRRLPTFLPARVALDGNGLHLAEGTVVDLSTQGALFDSDIPIRPGTELTVTLGPHPYLGHIQQRCTVVRLRRSERSWRWRVSLRFEAQVPTSSDALQRYLRALI